MRLQFVGVSAFVAVLATCLITLAPELALRADWTTGRTWLLWESSLLEEGARVGSPAHLAPSGLLLRAWAGTGSNLNILTSALAATSAAAVGLAATRMASPGLALAVALGFGWSAALWSSAVAAGGNLRPVLDLALLSLAVVAAKPPARADGCSAWCLRCWRRWTTSRCCGASSQ